jgi:PhzF family phenazine biosynthesis protein
MKLEMYQVNAFANKYNEGNPAGVIELTEFLESEVMISIAKENGYAETAFYTSNGEDYNLRWFTPLQEVELCGHATLATAYVISNEKNIKKEKYRFHTLSGLIEVSENNGWFELDMPASKIIKSECPSCIYEAIGVTPEEVYFDTDYLIVLNDENLIRDLKPDLNKFQELTERGTILTAKSNEVGVDFVSRWFGGKGIGIDEDPVTGSAHCLLTPYWSKELNKDNLVAKQISSRGGILLCSMSGDRVKVAGKACIYLKAEIYI